MAQITIETQTLERGRHEEAYQQVVRDLEAQGHTVKLRSAAVERSVPHDILAEAYAVAVYLAGHVDDSLVEALILVLFRRLASRPRRGQYQRRVKIIGPNGQVLRRVELPEEDEAG